MSSKVSILVATYNGEKYLRKQLDSILNQTYQNLEIIVQDDGSTDSTLEILKEYADKDPRVSASKNKHNLGIIQNFYDLIDKSSGDYIAISDQDDIWELNKIEVLLKHIGDQSLIYTDSLLIDANDQSRGMTLLEKLGHKPKSGRLLTDLFTHNTISGHACIFRSDLKEGILKFRNMSRNKGFMYDQVIGTIASFNQGIAYYAKPLTLHRIHDSNNHNTFKQTEKRSHLKKKKRRKIEKPSAFITRKKQRAKIKVKSAYQKIALFEKIFNAYCVKDIYNPYKIQPHPKESFKKCYFNFEFYIALKKAGVEKGKAKKLSFGKRYYIAFKSF